MTNTFKRIDFRLLILLLIIISCSKNKTAMEIQINKSKDTVAVNDLFKANLHLDNYKDRLPEFFIVSQPDTFNLLFNDTIKSAMFSATCHKTGNKIYKGFAQYYDSLGNQKKEDFAITFTVR